METPKENNKITFHNSEDEVKIYKSNDSKNSSNNTQENNIKESTNDLSDTEKQIVANLSTLSNENVEENFIIKPHRCHLYKYVGRSLFIFLDRYDNPLFIIGPHWPMYICLSSTFSIIMYLIYKKLWDKLSFPMKLIETILFWTFIISYTYTSIINPGYPKNTIKRALGIPRDFYYFCENCKFYLNKCSYASHCFDCNICIENYDHHCVWTSHCIGKYNLYSFYIFTIAAFCFGVFSIFALFLGLAK